MELREALLKEHSKRNTDFIVGWVGREQKHFDMLVALFLGHELKLSQRASWVVGNCVEVHPKLIKKHLTTIISNLQKNNLHDAVKRNTIRLLQFVELPEKLEGLVLDLCFNYLSQKEESIAVKVLSMIVLANIVQKYPELKPELILLIEEQLQMPTATAAIISRGRKTLTELNKRP